MKKLSLSLIPLLLIPLAAHAYSNSFLTMTTPSGWSVKEMKMPGAGDMVGKTAARSASSRIGGIPSTSGAGAAISGAIGAGTGIATDTAVAGVSYGVMKGMMKGMPKFANATFTNISHPDTQIMLMIIEGQSDSAGAGAGASSGRGSGESKCKTLENTKTNWGGSSARLFTMVCPQGNEWMYTTTVSMTKGKMFYTLMGTMPSKTKDAAAFNAQLKQARTTMLTSTSFK